MALIIRSLNRFQKDLIIVIEIRIISYESSLIRYTTEPINKSCHGFTIRSLKPIEESRKRSLDKWNKLNLSLARSISNDEGRHREEKISYT